MKSFYTIILILFSINLYSQRIVSWNIRSLGESKFKKDFIVDHISNVLSQMDPDIIAIQEVVTNPYGDSAIIKIARNMGYNYIISEKTTGPGTERYAFIWKHGIGLNWSKLETDLRGLVNREPFIAEFNIPQRGLMVIKQVHLVPSNKKPERELIQVVDKYNDFICGDFNIKCDNSAFDDMEFKIPTCDKPSTLKRDGSLTGNDYDHFLVNTKYNINSSYVFNYQSKLNKNLLSDHLPIFIELK